MVRTSSMALIEAAMSAQPGEAQTLGSTAHFPEPEGGRMPDRPVLLLASVGTMLGGAILDALDRAPELRARLRVVGLHSEADAANNFRCDRCYLGPAPGEEAPFQARLAEIVAIERPRLVLACRDDVLMPLAQLKERVDPAQTTVLVSSPRVIAIANDKYETHRFAQAHGLPFAETAVDRAGFEAIERRFGYPMIAKPRGGHGSRGVSVVRRRAEAEAALRTPGLCLQPYINPPDDLDARLPDLSLGAPLAFSMPGVTLTSCGALIDRDGAVIAFGASYYPLMIVGENRRGEPDPDPAMEAATRRFVAALIPEGLFGPFTIEFRRDRAGNPICMEINARMGGFWGARDLLGYPMVPHAIAHFMFEPQPPLAMPTTRTGFVNRALSDQLILDVDVARLAREGRWSAEP